MRPRSGEIFAVVAGLACCMACGCGTDGSSILLSPDGFGSDQGTLISIGDVRTVAQEMIQSMNANPRLSRLRAEKKPLRVLVGDFKQRTSITIFDKEVFINRLLGSLGEADVDQAYVFLRRGAGSATVASPDGAAPQPVTLEDSIAKERMLQAEGQVGSTAPPDLTGADLVLSGELRELLHRERVAGGGESEKRTVQYTLGLDRVEDGVRVWLHSYEIVKQQIVGAVYQ